MKSSSLNSEERKLQLMQLEERQLHSQCMAWFKELKIRLEFLHNNSLSVACLVTEGAALEACLVTEGITMDDNLVAKESTYDSIISSDQLDECNSSVEKKDIVTSCFDSEEQHMQQLLVVTKSNGTKSENSSSETTFSTSDNENKSSYKESSSSENDADADIGPSYDNDTVTETLRMLLPKEDNVNTGKQGLGFENQNDVVNPSLLNKAKELVLSLYNVYEMAKDLLSDHKIISEEELKCEAEKCLKVKQRKSPLSYLGFVYVQLSNYDPSLWKSLPMKYFCYVKKAMLKFEKETVSKKNPPRENVFINLSFEDNVKRIARNRLSEEFKPLVKDVNLQLKYFEKGLVKEMKNDLKYVTTLEDEFDEKCIILDIQTEFFKTQFDSAISESHIHMHENEMFIENYSLEHDNRCLKKTIDELSKQVADIKEEMKK
ncbi:hypothetical protein Tco_0386797 [Tanacetum coccineum]